MENRALGKGLSALIPNKKEGGEAEIAIQHISTALIEFNSVQPRTHYDEEKLAELQSSIKEKGVLQPILVRPKNDGYEVVAGERRLRAAKALSLDIIPTIVKSVTDQEALVIALIENIQREELNPIEEAKAFKKLTEDFHYTQDEVAKSVGKNRSTVTNLLRLLNLPQNIQDSVSKGELSMGHARALLGIESQNEKNRLLELTIKNSLSVRELENIIRSVTSTESGSRRERVEKTKSHEIITLEEDLQKILGTKVRINASKKRGQIVIEYYSLDDLDRVIQLIKK